MNETGISVLGSEATKPIPQSLFDTSPLLEQSQALSRRDASDCCIETGALSHACVISRNHFQSDDSAYKMLL